MYGHEPAKWKYYAPTVQILAALNVTRLFVQPDETPRHAQLMRGYRHGSDSPVVYERFCLARRARRRGGGGDTAQRRRPDRLCCVGPAARFITIAHVVELYNLESVLFVDADVVLFNNAYELLGGDHSWGFGSWTSFWLRHDAIAFADFVAAFYTGDPRHDAYTLKRYGSSVLEERSGAFWKKLEAEHRGWWPKELAGFDADGRPSGPRYYITDMEVYKRARGGGGGGVGGWKSARRCRSRRRRRARLTRRRPPARPPAAAQTS